MLARPPSAARTSPKGTGSAHTSRQPFATASSLHRPGTFCLLLSAHLCGPARRSHTNANICMVTKQPLYLMKRTQPLPCPPQIDTNGYIAQRERSVLAHPLALPRYLSETGLATCLQTPRTPAPNCHWEAHVRHFTGPASSTPPCSQTCNMKLFEYNERTR